MTIHARVALARQLLTESGISASEAAISARILAQHVLGWDAARFVANADDQEPSAFSEQYQPLVERRSRHEPVAYLTGQREFWGLDFEVSPAVLIPRPETELIVETVRELLPDRQRPLRIADIGTGSGCLAVAITSEYPAAQTVATDISSEAIDVARRNAARHHVADRMSFTTTDLLSGTTGDFDLMVSNPPYVREPDRPALQPEVRDHEPSISLFGGADGMSIIQRLLATAPDQLRPDGLLLFEFGLGKDDLVAELIAEVPALELLEMRQDLQGIPRVAVCRKRSGQSALEGLP